METHDLNGPMKTSGFERALRDHQEPVELRSTPMLQNILRSVRGALFALLARIGLPLASVALFAVITGTIVIRAIEQRIADEKAMIREEVLQRIKEILGPESPATVSPVPVSTSNPQTQPGMKTKIDVDGFIRTILFECHLPDKRAVFRIMADPTLSDEDKVRKITEILLTDPANREKIEKALYEVLKKSRDK